MAFFRAGASVEKVERRAGVRVRYEQWKEILGSGSRNKQGAYRTVCAYE
jgi:hypothetical protein